MGHGNQTNEETKKNEETRKCGKACLAQARQAGCWPGVNPASVLAGPALVLALGAQGRAALAALADRRAAGAAQAQQRHAKGHQGHRQCGIHLPGAGGGQGRGGEFRRACSWRACTLGACGACQQNGRHESPAASSKQREERAHHVGDVGAARQRGGVVVLRQQAAEKKQGEAKALSVRHSGRRRQRRYERAAQRPRAPSLPAWRSQAPLLSALPT